MKRATIFLLVLLFSQCNINPKPIASEVNLIPVPIELSVNNGIFALNEKTNISYSSDFLDQAVFLKGLIDGKSDFEIEMKESDKETGSNSISLHFREMENEEAYELKINKNGVELVAGHGRGMIYAIQTLRQLFPPNFNGDAQQWEKAWVLPALEIKDEPSFPWRGMLLDCCRHFMPKEFVLRYIDLLSYHKMNTLHWHLTEDQGWRIEIKKYPKLTEVGAWRTEKDGSVYGEFYTQEDIREVVAYAEKRGINIVPEIEMPGHSVAAIAAYPELSCTGEQIEVETEWGVFKDIYCAGNDQTFEFLKDVLDEVIELFPGKYIHIGGDEAPKYRWENCDKCQKRIKDNRLHDEHELQSWFIQEIEKYLSSKGKQLIGWDEILEGGLAEGAMVQSWRGMEGGIEAAKSGHDVIMSPTSHCYFDYGLKSIDLKKVYEFYPVPADLSEKESTHILGAECNMWTERAPYDMVDSKVFPRILAMAEVLWSDSSGRDFDEFYHRVQGHYARLSGLGVDYGLETNPITYSTEFDEEEKNLKLKLEKGVPDLEIFYSMKDSIPTPNDEVYLDGISVKESSNYFVRAFKNGKSYGDPVSINVIDHKLVGVIPEYASEFSTYYTGGGNTALTNGLKGTLDFRDGNWQAFQYDDIDLVFDIAGRDISSVETNFYQYNNSWVFLPEYVEYSISLDGEKYKELGTVKNTILPEQNGSFIQSFKSIFPSHKGKFLKVKGKNMKYCPEWHEAAGSHTWLFIDEVIVN